ncbi:MAG: PAS domain-containing sensor histidine kinase, partial [Cyclobacteriaceae bacterium]|nr:PAS domain-containing sensor histidine kinase [Cyclobacteriaceae bacterium]
GSVMSVVNTNVDITGLKMAEEELIKSEERFRQLMEQSPLAMEILSTDGKINVVNSAWRKLWNLGDEEAVETIDKYNMLTDPQIERLGIMDEVKEAFKGKHIILPAIQYDTGQSKDDFDLEMLKELKSPWIQCHLNAVKDAEGNIVYIVNTYVDITDLRKAEVEVQEQRDVLARIDRATSMGQLTGSIAHELNQPLTGILGNAQAAEMMLRNDAFESKELLEIMGDIVSDTKRAGDVIRNLRDLYKDQKNIEFSIIDINAILDETLLLLHSELVKYDVKLKRINESDTPEINGNKVQIQQVIVNLIMNAIEAMSSIDTQYFILTITTKYSDSEVKVYIDDLGPGIDEDKIDQIFQPLATWKSGGTGMGLAISNSIIESHGGRMVAENLSGGGARVGFEIPIINKN